MEKQIRVRYLRIQGALNERARRLFAANEAMVHGHGGVAMVSRATGMARRTISQGLKELAAMEAGEEPLEIKGRARRPGAGGKKATEKDPDAVDLLGPDEVLVRLRDLRGLRPDDLEISSRRAATGRQPAGRP